MVTVITELSKYMIIFLFAFYTIGGFVGISLKRAGLLAYQRIFLFLIQFLAFLSLYLKTNEMKYLILYVFEALFIVIVMAAYQLLYAKMSILIINNMCMLLTVGGIILARLSFSKCVKQFVIAFASFLITLLIPIIIRKWRFLKNLTWLYAGLGIALLAAMKLTGVITNGASITFTIAGVTIQPVEFVKIIFVFFMAAFLSKRHELKDLIIVSVIAGLHILLLVWSKELGGALIFFVVYLVLIYVSSHQPLYPIVGLAGGGIAAFVAYHLFRHVRVRVLTWSTPFSVIKNDASQISQSLFAIGTGGWFGLGLMNGIPNKIPISAEDLVFSAITEELGMLFSICLILICLSTFIMFINIATCIRHPFYKLLAVGFGTEYIFQVFLTIGGGTKFIPLTGVTLPLVSYGGSSFVCSMAMFAIIQGIYTMRQDEHAYEEDELELDIDFDEEGDYGYGRKE